MTTSSISSTRCFFTTPHLLVLVLSLSSYKRLLLIERTSKPFKEAIGFPTLDLEVFRQARSGGREFGNTIISENVVTEHKLHPVSKRSNLIWRERRVRDQDGSELVLQNGGDESSAQMYQTWNLVLETVKRTMRFK
jgi:hypothetical protein